MTIFNSPFASSSTAIPGNGTVVLSILPPGLPTLTTLTYKYPLKLLSRAPAFTPHASIVGKLATRPVHLYLLTYGGGLLPGDHINVAITLDHRTRMVVTTPQGSTKIFKTPPKYNTHGTVAPKDLDDDVSSRGDRQKQRQEGSCKRGCRQTLDVKIGRDAGLCYLPDPSAPFKDSRYEQVQKFTIHTNCPPRQLVDKQHPAGDQNQRSSLCVLDWVTQGRVSRGENWDFHVWKGKNEVWTEDALTGKHILLLRDSVILDNEIEPEVEQDRNQNGDDYFDITTSSKGVIREHTSGHGIMGTLILYGPLFNSLGSYFMNTFTSEPRIGGRNWSAATTGNNSGDHKADQKHHNHPPQVRPPQVVTWTAARVRAGFVLVKFGAKDFESARDWLGGMIRHEGSVLREFGEEALFCL